MAITFCTSGAVHLKAGNKSGTILTEAQYTEVINQAESFLNNVIKIEGINLVSDYSSQDGDVKKILEDAASSHAALVEISAGMDQYSSTFEAQTLLDVNYTRVQDAVKILKEKNTTDFLRSFNT